MLPRRIVGLATALSLSLLASAASTAGAGLTAKLKDALKGLSCGTIVDKLPDVSPVGALAELLGGRIKQCKKDFNKGFLCSIPDAVVSSAHLLGALGETALAHCKKFILAPMAIPPCALAYFLPAKVKSAVKCVKALVKRGAIWEALLDKTLEVACSTAGSLLADVVLAAASGGTSFAGSVAKWLTKISEVLGKLSPTALIKGHKLKVAVGMAKDVLKGVSECR